MKFNFYTSVVADCEESYIIEQEGASPLVYLYCDDCNKKHNFQLEISLDSVESVWKYIKKMGFDDESY